MKKLIFLTLLFAACSSTDKQNGTYVNHTDGQFSVADDTITLANGLIIHHIGYQKKRNGKLLRKEFKTRKWTMNNPDAPPMQINDEHIEIGKTIYYRIP